MHTAWEVSTGRPDVLIDVLDSGIEWNSVSAMTDLRAKVHLNQGELPAPRDDLATALVPGIDCSKYASATGGDYNPRGDYDINRDGVFNVLDYACDSRVAAVVSGGSPRHALRHGPPGFLVPEDLILAFSDGVDHDHNGFASDIAGWNFLDDNNDPFDDVQYGHGTGELQDSGAEANNGGNVGTRPNCMVLPLRVGESFVTDANRFAQAALYATDSGVDVIQEALGTVNAPNFARQAIEYAYGPRCHRDRVSRRRGGRAPQPAGVVAGCDRRREFSHEYSSVTSSPAVVPAAERLHELRDPGDPVGAEQFLFLRGNGQGRRRCRPDLRRRRERAARRQADKQRGLPARRRIAVRDHPQ